MARKECRASATAEQTLAPQWQQQAAILAALRLLETADHAPTLETFDSWTHHMEEHL